MIGQIFMNASTLERSISDFSNSLSRLNGWLVGMTAIVVLGLLIEYVPELRDEWKKFREAGAWRSLATRHSKGWRPIAILLGAALVTTGVAGEMLFEALSFRKEGQLEQAHTHLDDHLREESESAETAARGAVEAFQNATSELNALTLQIEQAQTKANAAVTTAGGAQRSANTATHSVEEVRQLATQLRAEVAEIDVVAAAMASRHMLRTLTFLGLQGERDKSLFNLTVETFDKAGTPTWIFAHKLVTALQELGFTTARFTVYEPNDGFPLPSGVTIKNKWTSLTKEAGDFPVSNGPQEVDPMYIWTELRHLPPRYAGTLGTLKLALGSSLQQDSSLNDGDFIILIGN
jgi:hypothetical protein